MPCHFVFYYSPQAVIRCGQVRTMWGPWLLQSRCCRTATNPPAWKCFIEDFMHSHCEMSWSTMFQKPHLVNASSVAQVCYSVIPPLFRMWKTIDIFIKEEIWARNMTGSYASSYCHVWWVVFHVSHMLGMQCDPVDKIPWVNLHICLKINLPQDKAVGSCSISKAHG